MVTHLKRVSSTCCKASFSAASAISSQYLGNTSHPLQLLLSWRWKSILRFPLQHFAFGSMSAAPTEYHILIDRFQELLQKGMPEPVNYFILFSFSHLEHDCPLHGDLSSTHRINRWQGFTREDISVTVQVPSAYRILKMHTSACHYSIDEVRLCSFCNICVTLYPI